MSGPETVVSPRRASPRWICDRSEPLQAHRRTHPTQLQNQSTSRWVLHNGHGTPWPVSTEAVAACSRARRPRAERATLAVTSRSFKLMPRPKRVALRSVPFPFIPPPLMPRWSEPRKAPSDESLRRPEGWWSRRPRRRSASTKSSRRRGQSPEDVQEPPRLVGRGRSEASSSAMLRVTSSLLPPSALRMANWIRAGRSQRLSMKLSRRRFACASRNLT